MVEIQLNTVRGAFQLEVTCTFKALWNVIFGPSGAGKSTLLRLIAGLDRPQSGRIAIHGRYVTDAEMGLYVPPGPRSYQRETALVTQQAALFPHMKVAANVAYGLAKQGGAGTLTEAMLELVGASHLADRWPRTLSGGEAQRVALARALAPSPRLLLLDEPLSALDAAARDAVLMRVGPWLEEQRIQTILVTHDAADAIATEAEVVLLQEGRLVAQGPAATVLASERERLLTRLL